MDDRTRYGASLEGDTLYLEGDGDRIEIGPMDGIVDLIGGETYALEYTERQAAASWLPTDDDATITIDVRDALAEWEYTEAFVANVEPWSLEEVGESGYSYRLEVFVDLVTEIWDTRGNLEG